MPLTVDYLFLTCFPEPNFQTSLIKRLLRFCYPQLPAWNTKLLSKFEHKGET